MPRDIQIVTEAELRRVLSDCGYPACEKGAPGSNPLRNALKSALGRRPEGEGHTFLRLTSIADSFCGCFRIK